MGPQWPIYLFLSSGAEEEVQEEIQRRRPSDWDGSGLLMDCHAYGQGSRGAYFALCPRLLITKVLITREEWLWLGQPCEWWLNIVFIFCRSSAVRKLSRSGDLCLDDGCANRELTCPVTINTLQNSWKIRNIINWRAALLYEQKNDVRLIKFCRNLILLSVSVALAMMAVRIDYSDIVMVIIEAHIYHEQ